MNVTMDPKVRLKFHDQSRQIRHECCGKQIAAILRMHGQPLRCVMGDDDRRTRKWGRERLNQERLRRRMRQLIKR